MSSSSQKGSLFTENPLTLSLFKISYSSSATIQGNFTWTHLPQRDNIFAVFDGLNGPAYGASNQAGRVLKLVQNSDLLVEISLDDLLYQARQDDERALSQAYADTYRSVLIIIKKPLIALRYQAPNGQVRRIQINFLPVEGYNQAVGIFRRIGLPMKDGNGPIEPQFPTRRLLSSINSHSSIQSIGGTRPVSSDLRELIVQDQGNQNIPKEIAAHGLHQPMLQDVGGPYHTPYYPTEHARPSSSTSFFGSNLITSESHPRQRPVNSVESSIFDVSSDRSLSSSTKNSDDIASRNFSSRSSALLLSPEFVTRPTISDARPVLPISFGRQNESQRPSTAPLTLTQMLPPKRELPFPKRPLTATSLDLDSQPPPSSAPILTLPPPRVLPFPKSKQPINIPPGSSPDITGSPPWNISSSAPAPNRKKPKGKSPKSKSKAQPRKRRSQNGKENASEVPTANANAGTHARNPSLNLTAETKTKSASDVVNGDTHPSGPLSTIAQSKQPVSTVVAPTHSITTTTASLFSSITPENYMARLDFLVRAYNNLPTPPPQPAKRSTISEDLAAYAAQSEDERMMYIDDLICECLEDKNFGTLCEDVERSWKRIGLGF